MQFNDDRSGVPTFMIGMIVLVMAGVGLSIVVDTRFSFSSEHSAARKEVRANEETISDFKFRHQECSTLLAGSSDKRRSEASELEEFARELEALKGKKNVLRSRQLALETSIRQLETDDLRYRNEYQQKSWASAIGESLGDLSLKGGRDYEDVKITRVTEAGLEVSHRNGFARIPAMDLDPKLRDRLQIGLTKRPISQKPKPDLTGNPERKPEQD